GRIPSRDGSLGRFATINSTTGAVTAQLGTARDNTNLSSAAANENVVYRPASSLTSANATLTNSIAPQTIVFEARATGQSVDLGGNTLTTPGIIVERPILGSGAVTFALDNGNLATPGGSAQN